MRGGGGGRGAGTVAVDRSTCTPRYGVGWGCAVGAARQVEAVSDGGEGVRGRFFSLARRVDSFFPRPHTEHASAQRETEGLFCLQTTVYRTYRQPSQSRPDTRLAYILFTVLARHQGSSTYGRLIHTLVKSGHTCASSRVAAVLDGTCGELGTGVWSKPLRSPLSCMARRLEPVHG